jgi:CRISPR-associated protein (TIGR02584 family)
MTERAHRSSTSRNVLVAVAGQTPAIITETLWALEHLRNVPIDEIRVITTSHGRECIVSRLLGREGGFTAYCRDYEVPFGRIAFSESSIHVLKDIEGLELEDIRTSLDNSSAADQVFSLIQEWTKRKDEVLYCSVAGGRKTLGIYLAMSLMLCGRKEDSLSHVLVAQLFETGVREFYHPPPEPRLYNRHAGFDADGKAVFEPISSDASGVELADVPFPRLREAMGGELPLEGGLMEAVARSQLLLSYLQAPPPLVLRLDGRFVRLGDFSFHLPRQLMAVYAFFLLEFNEPHSASPVEALFGKRLLLARLERCIDRYGQGERETYAWEKMKDVDDFKLRMGPCISKINKAVDSAMGRNLLSARFRISTGGKYSISVARFQVLETEELPWQDS